MQDGRLTSGQPFRIDEPHYRSLFINTLCARCVRVLISDVLASFELWSSIDYRGKNALNLAIC